MEDKIPYGIKIIKELQTRKGPIEVHNPIISKSNKYNMCAITFEKNRYQGINYGYYFFG